jgi:hypothetical protein
MLSDEALDKTLANVSDNAALEQARAVVGDHLGEATRSYPVRKTLPRHPRHLHLAPFNSKISAARSFWLTHGLWPHAKPCVFNQAAALRSRLMKQDLGSTPVGAVFSSRARSLPDCPSMAFKSGECLGWVVSKSNANAHAYVNYYVLSIHTQRNRIAFSLAPPPPPHKAMLIGTRVTVFFTRQFRVNFVLGEGEA